jgi:hypothetical protein
MVVHPAQAKPQIDLSHSGPSQSLAGAPSPIRIGEQRICKHFRRECHDAGVGSEAAAIRLAWLTPDSLDRIDSISYGAFWSLLVGDRRRRVA